jgi:hypothetical protein
MFRTNQQSLLSYSHGVWSSNPSSWAYPRHRPHSLLSMGWRPCLAQSTKIKHSDLWVCSGHCMDQQPLSSSLQLEGSHGNSWHWGKGGWGATSGDQVPMPNQTAFFSVSFLKPTLLPTYLPYLSIPATLYKFLPAHLILIAYRGSQKCSH